MLKNVYFQFGDSATNFLIDQYCKNNKQYLAENNLHYIELQDFIDKPIEYDWVDFFHCNLFRGKDYFQKDFPDISYQDIIIQLKKYIEEQEIENLVVPVANSFFDVIVPYFIIFCKSFPETVFHCEMNTTNFLRHLSVQYNLPFLLIRKDSFYTPIYTFYVRLSARYVKIYSKIQSSAKNIFNCSFKQNFFSNEIEGFENWLTTHNLSKQSEVLPAGFSPQVLAFITAVKEYYFQDASFNFINEPDFLYAYSSPTTFYSYYSEAIKKDYLEKNPAETPLPLSAPYEEADCSKASLRITLDEALFLAAKLSSSTRQKLLQGFNTEDINYMPVSSATVYLALMYAEGRIELEEILAYLKAPLGRVSEPETAYKENPILTIYTASYNNKKYIKQCIDSILAQKTKYPFIHLICDDGSTDGSQELIREYAQKYPHIQAVLRKKNNMQINYHAIYNNIATKYTAVCDSDDFYTDQRKLEKQIDVLEKNEKYGLCFHSAYVYYEADNMIKYVYPVSMPEFTAKNTYYISNIILTNLMQSSSVMYRWLYQKGLCHSVPFSSHPLDWASNIIHSYQNKIAFINEPMSLYRRHSHAVYYDTEVSVAKHVISNCFSELSFCKCLDIYTDKKYHNVFLQKVFSILSLFYFADEKEEVDKEKYQAMEKRIAKFMPDYLVEFNAYLHKMREEQKDN